MNYKVPDDSIPVSVMWKIGLPEKNLLYPAELNISHGSFSGTYHVLLVKKSAVLLAIGRNKVPSAENPFSLGAWTVFLNGNLRLTRNRQNKSILISERVISKRYGLAMPALLNYDDSIKRIAMNLRSFLKDGAFALEKENNQPFIGIEASRILYPWISDAYYGIMDSIELKTGNGLLNFADNNKIDNDTVWVSLNGRQVIAPTDLSRKNPSASVQLDTGLNILVFFADNYGRVPPNTGKLNLAFGKEKFAINFANKADISSTFIVAKLYFHPDPKDENSSELLRTTKLVDSFHTSSGIVKLAIWDDAVEDGDSISLNVNGTWIAQGFAVKKQPQFLEVVLRPGNNNIIFVADNLGAIAPNTSLLEIIDGSHRRSFSINTDLKKNNLVKITYDYHLLE